MKCHSEKAMKELIWRTSLEFAMQNLKILLIVLHEDFGFGRDRLLKVVDCLKDKVRKYDEADNDGVIDYAINRDIGKLGLDKELTEFLTGNVGPRHASRKHKPDRSVSVAEAAEMQAKMRAFEDVQASCYDMEVRKK